MTTKVALVLPVAVSQTAPRLWPSPVAYSKLPRVTQTCLQVSDVNWLSEAVLIPSPTYLTSTCSLKVDCLNYISSYDLIWDCQNDHLWLAMTSLLNMQTNTQLQYTKTRTLHWSNFANLHSTAVAVSDYRINLLPK